MPSDELDAGEQWLRDGLSSPNDDGAAATVDDAAAALGADPAEVGKPMTVPEAVAALGGDLRDQMRATVRRPSRDRRHRNRMEVRNAAAALGEKTTQQRLEERHKRWYLATTWRYATVARCRNMYECVRLVALIESSLSGDETEIPPQLLADIERIIERSATKPADVPTIMSSRMLYQQAFRRWRESESE